MYFCLMIVVTGAAGFIGSCLVSRLNILGFENLILVDDFSFVEKNKNLVGKRYSKKIERMLFVNWLTKNASKIKFIAHNSRKTLNVVLSSAFQKELFVCI